MEDLIGPHRPDEVFQGVRVRPSDIYLTGILWTSTDRMGAQDDDGGEGDDEEDDSPSTSSLIGQQRPCSMGLSLCLKDSEGSIPVHVTATFATYEFEAIPAMEDRPAELKWSRRQHVIDLPALQTPASGSDEKRLEVGGLLAEVWLHVRARPSKAGRLVTLTLINRSVPPEGNRNEAESLLLFQSRMEVRPAGEAQLMPRPSRPAANDEDEQIGRLLYRNSPEFAAGHHCSASWEASGRHAAVVRTEWMPQTTVTAFREEGAEVFSRLVADGAFDAARLASLADGEVLDRLQRLPDAYAEWIGLRTAEVAGLPLELQSIAKLNLQSCDLVSARMSAGINAMRAEPKLLQAFKLANAAMALQYSWKGDGSNGLRWRPFQLGFILLASESVCKPEAMDREVLDLLWFPTGGGKTEAYLALVAMLAFYRRASHGVPDHGAGNAALMRYTLRLLTAQQFERAAALILACELIRRGKAPGVTRPFKMGEKPFSIGLWVGRDATPNDFKTALSNRGTRDGSSAEQIDECPCCHGKVRWQYDESAETVRPYCDAEACQLGKGFGPWPVLTVDDDIYRERPTLLIGTIDKFALITTKDNVAQLFGFGTLQCPDLVIQDELHLISGPLGTIAGLYETAFDWLLRKGDRRPKVIGSTATIRRAADQVRALFDRKSCQFPPPGLDHDDSGFAVRDRTKTPRAYVGVTTAGRSAKFTLQAIAGSLLQATGATVGLSDSDRDGYSTLLAYFNSLRELGGAIVQMLDDVPDSMTLYAGQRAERVRQNELPRELTSRASQKEIVEILAELKIKAGRPGAVDVVLATNMVSVGVDVSRLGLMVMNGQPKTRSEYIQASSRVGRSLFPGLIVSSLNAAKPRDRSHFETFFGWHSTLYRDVEATSVTPFASRARDRALHAALVAMVRHSAQAMKQSPKLSGAPDSLLQAVVAEIERRVASIDPREVDACGDEINERLDNWDAREPTYYNNGRAPNKSLMISADLNAQRRASGRLPPAAWPTMNNMRSVEASTRFRMAEGLSAVPRARGAPPADGSDQPPAAPQPRWRRSNG